MAIEKTQKRTILFLTALVLVFALGLWLPQRLHESRLQTRIDQMRRELSDDRDSTQGLDELTLEVARLQKTVDEDQRYVPTDHELADLLRRLSTHLQQQRVTDQEIQTLPVANGADYSVIPVTLRFRGSFPAVFGFLKQAETMRRLVRITKLEVFGAPGSPDPVQVRVDLCSFSTAGEGSQP